jgi:hypothetical protein
MVGTKLLIPIIWLIWAVFANLTILNDPYNQVKIFCLNQSLNKYLHIKGSLQFIQWDLGGRIFIPLGRPTRVDVISPQQLCLSFNLEDKVDF